MTNQDIEQAIQEMQHDDIGLLTLHGIYTWRSRGDDAGYIARYIPTNVPHAYHKAIGILVAAFADPNVDDPSEHIAIILYEHFREIVNGPLPID